MIGQQARLYDIGLNTLAHEFALVTTTIFADTYTGDIQSKTKKISQTKVFVGQIKRKKIIYSITDYSIFHFMFAWYLVDKNFSTKMSQDMQLLSRQSLVQTGIANQQ